VFILVYVYRVSQHVHKYVYRPIATVVFYWGHCKCLASLVGSVHVL